MPDADAIYHRLRDELPAVAWLPEECWIVGGSLRDVLLDVSPKDLDCAAPSAGDAANAFAAKTGGRPVCLAKQPLETWRVVLHGLDWDFTDIDGGSIEADLERRDFTIGALALSVREPHVLLDPHDGRGDVDRRLVRAVSPANLVDDPLRMLRAVRLAGRFGFEIEPETRACILANASRVGESAVERITNEIDAIVSLRDVSRALEMLRSLGLDVLAVPGGIGEEDVRRCAGIWSPDPVTRYAALFVGRETAVDEHADASRWSRVRKRDVVSLLKFVSDVSGEESFPMLVHEHGVRTARRAAELLAALGEVELARKLSRLVRDRGASLEDVRPILAAAEIRELLKIGDGPRLGAVLRSLVEAQIRGEVRTRAEAIAFVRGVES